MKKKNNRQAKKRGQPRKRVVPIWRGRAAAAVLGILVIGASAGGAWYLWQSGWLDGQAAKLRRQAIALTGDLGFKVDEIIVSGRRETSRADLLRAVRLARGAPILAFDLGRARKRVERLPWVRSASVQRMLPDTVILTIEERRPLALWQNKERFRLIDRDGEVIRGQALQRFSSLPVVVGPGAPALALEFLTMLRSQPGLAGRVEAAVRVGGRRWNVRLKGGIDVRLPAAGAKKAWARLAEYERKHKILERDVRVLDLRLPDRLIVREGPGSKKSEKKPDRET
jgi:cell division protein FtsQ